MTPDDFFAWLETSAPKSYRERVAFHAVAIEDYRELWLQMGVLLPSGIDALVAKHGLVQIPSDRDDVAGFLLADEAELFNYFQHCEAAYCSGVKQAENWIIFATEHGDLEPAYAVDLRFPNGQEFAVGSFHQDLVCTSPLTKSKRLPKTFASFSEFIEDYFATVRRQVESMTPSQLAKYAEVAELPAYMPIDISEVEKLEHEFAIGKLDWCNRSRATWPAMLVRKATVPATLAKLLEHIRVDFTQAHGQFIVDAKNVLNGGGWPYDCPGPTELLHRLPLEQQWGRRHVALWALQAAAYTPTHPALLDAIAFVERWIETGEVNEAERQERLQMCAAEAWKTRATPKDANAAAELFFARALTWLLGRKFSPEQAAHVAAEGVSLAKRREVRFTQWELFEKLSAIVLGRPDEIPGRMRTQVAHPALSEIEHWLNDATRTQRETLAGLQQIWLPRLSLLPPEIKKRAAQLIRRAINSKKLLPDRDALLHQLESS